MSIPGICRCCLSEGLCCYDLSSEYLVDGKAEVYNDLLANVFSISISKDLGTNLICELCTTQLTDAARFKNKVLKSEELLTWQESNGMHNIEDVIEIKSELLEEPDNTSFSQIDVAVEDLRNETLSNDDTEMERLKMASESTNITKATKGSVKKYCKDSFLLQKINAATIITNSNVCPFHHLKSTFKCIYCHTQYLDFQELREHNDTHSIDKQKRLVAIKSIAAPIKIDTTDLKCSCGQPFDNLINFKVHLVEAHNISIHDTYHDGVIPFRLQKHDGYYTCHVCEETFSTFYNLNKHINVHFNNFVCEYCARSFVAQHRLKAHLASHETGEHTCDKCNRKYKSAFKLKNHVNSVHFKKSRLKCPYCPEKFKENHVKMKHLKEEHNHTLTFKCELCSMVFDSRRSLTRHRQRQHLPKYICDVCGCSYLQKNQLLVHQLAVHSEPSFKCHICSKTYKRKVTLQRHKKVHFTCDVD